MKTGYWLAGASWGGTDHQDNEWLKKGIWMLGWEDGHQVGRTEKLKEGDRIAIKRLLGKGQVGLRIMHIGVVRGVVRDTNKVICTVDWVAQRLNRKISESRGCFQSIHGPYFKSDEATTRWIEEIFCL